MSKKEAKIAARRAEKEAAKKAAKEAKKAAKNAAENGEDSAEVNGIPDLVATNGEAADVEMQVCASSSVRSILIVLQCISDFFIVTKNKPKKN